MLILFQNYVYLGATLLGLLCYWLNVFDDESVRCRDKNIPFYVLNYLSRQRYYIPLTTIMTVVCNVLWAQYVNKKHDPVFITFELFTLAWGGGSILRAAMKLYQRALIATITKFAAGRDV